VSIAQAGVLAIAIVCGVTLVAGAFGLKLSRTTSDFYVAGRSVSAGWNASAIGGEYLSAASFLGIAGLVYALGADMLWFPVGYTVGYVVLLVLVAAPLRRSGAYTLPDFAEARLESRHVRTLASLLVIGIGWLYLLPQFQGAGIALSTVTGAPPALGSLIVAVVVLANVTAGGMRSITLVQAMQYWLKLTAISMPAFVLLALWWQSGAAGPNVAPTAGADWGQALSGFGGREHPVYATYSTILALCFGTMGLPHVLVRFYTNPDGRAARRTTLVVLVLLGIFYVLPPVYGALGRIYAGDLVAEGRADSVVIQLPLRMIGGTGGELLAALLVAGAFAAFLSTSSGLTIAVAGVLSQDLMSRWLGGIASFRVSAVLAVSVAYVLAVMAEDVGVATAVGLAFAVAASTFCPLLLLGIWWRGLTAPGAMAGLIAGGATSVAAVGATMFGVSAPGFLGAALSQPAALTVPLSFAVMLVGSRLTRAQLPRHLSQTMVRLHAPEQLHLDRGSYHPERATVRRGNRPSTAV